MAGNSTKIRHLRGNKPVFAVVSTSEGNSVETNRATRKGSPEIE